MQAKLSHLFNNKLLTFSTPEPLEQSLRLHHINTLMVCVDCECCTFHCCLAQLDMQCFKLPLNGLHFCTNINLFEYNSAFHAVFRTPQYLLPCSPGVLPSACTSSCSLQPLYYSAQSFSAATWTDTLETPSSQLGQSYCREDNFSAKNTTHSIAKICITELRKL